MNNYQLKGKTVHLRLATLNDAEFIHSLRINEKLNKHISKVNGTSKDQEAWLKKYKERERTGCEYYFIIVRNDNDSSIGTIRLYGLTDDNRFCWGSWVLNSEKTITSALESAYLLYKFAFEEKKFKSAYFQVEKNNTQVISFHKKTGAISVDSDEINEHFIYSFDSYNEFKNRYINIVETK